jgi:hypothetical protein
MVECPKSARARKLLDRVLSVVDHQIRSLAQRVGGLVVLSVPFGPGAKLDRVVVRHVRNRCRAVAHSKAKSSASFVRDLHDQHVEVLDEVPPGLERAHAPVAFELAHCHREVRRRHRPCHELLRDRVLSREQNRNPGVRPVAGRKERQAVSVVPMQVPEEDSAPERSRPARTRDRFSAGRCRRRGRAWALALPEPEPRSTCCRRSGRTGRRARGCFPAPRK